MDYLKLAEDQRKAAQETLRKLDAEVLTQKLSRRTEILQELKSLEKELSSLLGVGALAAGEQRAGRVRAPRRTSVGDSERAGRVDDLLSRHPHGLSAKRIAADLNDIYSSVQSFLKKHPEKYVRSGEKKSTVYTLNK
jgi:hypothetical protein